MPFTQEWYLRLGGSHTSDLPIHLHGQRKQLLGTPLLILITQLSELMEETLLSGISLTFSSVAFPQ